MISDNRIEALAYQAKGINTLLDIGTDHGLVLKHAIDNNYIKNAIAADIAEKPLENAKENLKNYPVSYYVSDGFEKIDEHFDGVVIAGIGAPLMTKILGNAPKNEKTYILQPNSKHGILRIYLAKNNFKIVDETIVYENDYYYVIIKAVKGEMILTEKDIFLGPQLKLKNNSVPYYKHLLNRYLPLVDKAKGYNRIVILQKVKWLKQLIMESDI